MKYEANKQSGFAHIILVILIGVIVVGAFVLGTKYPSLIEIFTNKSLPKPSPLTTQSPLVLPTDTIPKPNSIYLGEFEGNKVLFVTNSSLGKYYEQGIEKFSEYSGEWSFGSGINNYPKDYRDLESPKRILNLSRDVLQINNFKISDDKMFIYISLMLITKPSNSYPDNITNHVYRVNLSSLKESELWSHDMLSGGYKNAGGATTVSKISSDNNYLVLSIYDCFACEGSEAGLIILNTQTKKERYFEKIGNVEFNLSNNTFSYQNLAPFKEDCGSEGGPGCDNNNQRTVYKSTGEIITESLP